MPPRQPPGKLYITSLGEAGRQTEERVFSAVQSRFGLSCEILPAEPKPDFALDALRNQYNSLQVLEWLEDKFCRSGEWIFGITNVDLFIPVLTFVFGEARLGGSSAVLSTCRLHEEFYGRPADRVVFLSRVDKEAVHEVGHMLGLTHCLDRNCVMYASNNLVHTDVKSDRLCPECHSCLPRWCQELASDPGRSCV